MIISQRMKLAGQLNAHTKLSSRNSGNIYFAQSVQLCSNFKLFAVAALLTDNICKLKRNWNMAIPVWMVRIWPQSHTQDVPLVVCTVSLTVLSVQYPLITSGPFVVHISFCFLLYLNDGKNKSKSKYSVDWSLQKESVSKQ